MLAVLIESLIDAVVDTIKITPFLFVAYLIMEYIEHKSAEWVHKLLCTDNKLAPIIAAALGIIPQCGFSTLSAGLYCGGMLSAGTLLAIFITTSDEFILLAAGKIAAEIIILVLAIKFVLGAIIGLVTDRIIKPKHDHNHIHEICEHGKCHCDSDNIVLAALKHCLITLLFILAANFVINSAVAIIGIDTICMYVSRYPIFDVIFCAVVGLIPTCAGSIVITSLYIDQVISLGALVSGLIAGAGTGVLVLLKSTKQRRNVLYILLALFLIALSAGFFIKFITVN